LTCLTLQKNKKYTSLDFSGNGFDDKVIEPLLDLIKTKANLEELRVGGNKLGDSGIKAILAVLRKQSPKR
jgi:Ran GTPase-activating protein (RanGAP) involved in mRNA processing and transport